MAVLEHLALCLQLLGIWSPLNGQKKQIVYAEALLDLDILICTPPAPTPMS